MKKIAFVIGMIIASNANAYSDIMTCQTIQNADARNYCLAQATGERWRCDSIMNADKRAECKAGVSK